MDERSSFVGATVAGRYLLEQLIPGGADNTNVLAARDTRGSVPVVVRLVTVDSLVGWGRAATAAEAVEGFQQHLLSVAGVQHPVLVAPLDWGEVSIAGTAHLFVVTERLAGTSVRELLDRGRRLTPSQALVIGIDVCRALHHLHQLGIAHGDIRPANVFVGTDARARLAGIGIKRAASTIAEMTTEQGRYAAPELASDTTPTAAADVYALALTMLEMLTGDVPFAADSAAVTLANRAGKLLPVSADIGPVAVPMEKAARPDAADRSSALEFGQALAQLAAKLPRPEPIESLTTESFRDTITRQLEAVPAPQPTAPVAETSAPPPTTADVAVTAPRAERRRYRVLWSIAAVVALTVSGVLAWQSLSATSYAVPDLVGIPEGEARNAVSQFGWNVLIRAQRSDDVELGDVISTTPAAGMSLREGDDITLVVSEGATLALLPDVIGLSRDDAIATLQSAGLTVSESLRDDDSVPAGSVVGWIVTEQPNLVAGSQVLRGTEVAIVVSGGPVLRAVPNLIGLSEADADIQLIAVQLNSQRNDDVFSSDIPIGLIATQEPAAGAQLSRAGIVAYALSKGPETVELPNVIGLALADAQKRLNEVGIYVGTTSGRTTSKVRTVQQEGKTLKSGDVVLKGSVVDLVFP
ncbi:MAG: PASTA domain-containing protein [Actinobacteria bacterium]|nr:PASTA domain-containing protein [Actinomycetota bacterium]